MGLEREFLRTSPLLVGLADAEMDALVQAGQSRRWRKGERIVEEGTPSDSLFILMNGTVQVEKSLADDGRGARIVLASMQEPGDFFGEMSLIDIQPRSAHIYASEDVEILAFPKKMLANLFTQFPRMQMTLILNIARNLSLRLREADEKIVALSRGLERKGSRQND